MDDRAPYWLAERPLEAEFQRLEQQASLSDPAVKIRLSVLGLRPGMRCLEVGPGTGSMVRWLVEQGASVTAVDLSDRFFVHYEAPQVVQQVGDVRTVPLGGDYDFVLVQLLLHHLPERRDVISRLVGSLRPGGWLVVNEPDVRFMWTHSGPKDVVAWFKAILPRFPRARRRLQLRYGDSCHVAATRRWRMSMPVCGRRSSQQALARAGTI